MPPRNNSEPPPVMTWPKAMPVLVVAGVFDLVRMFFNMFWFFGPALAAVLCTTVVNNALGTTVSNVLGMVITGTCAGAAASLGTATFGMTAAFGTLMAIATGLLGWMVCGFWLMRTNARIFKENVMWFVASLAISEVPIVGTAPALTIVLWRMHSHHIKTEKAAYAKWEKENADTLQQQRNQQLMRFAQLQAAEEAQFRDDELASADVY